MVMKTELTLDELNAKWKSLFKSREEMEVTNISMMDDVWGKEEDLKKEIKKVEKDNGDGAEYLRKFNQDRTKQRNKAIKSNKNDKNL